MKICANSFQSIFILFYLFDWIEILCIENTCTLQADVRKKINHKIYCYFLALDGNLMILSKYNKHEIKTLSEMQKRMDMDTSREGQNEVKKNSKNEMNKNRSTQTNIRHNIGLAQWIGWNGMQTIGSERPNEWDMNWLKSITFHFISFHFMASSFVYCSVFHLLFCICHANFIDILLKLCLHIIELCRVYPIPNYENRFTEAYYLIIRAQHALNCKNCTSNRFRICICWPLLHPLLFVPLFGSLLFFSLSRKSMNKATAAIAMNNAVENEWQQFMGSKPLTQTHTQFTHSSMLTHENATTQTLNIQMKIYIKLKWITHTRIHLNIETKQQKSCWINMRKSMGYAHVDNI